MNNSIFSILATGILCIHVRNCICSYVSTAARPEMDEFCLLQTGHQVAPVQGSNPRHRAKPLRNKEVWHKPYHHASTMLQFNSSIAKPIGQYRVDASLLEPIKHSRLCPDEWCNSWLAGRAGSATLLSMVSTIGAEMKASGVGVTICVVLCVAAVIAVGAVCMIYPPWDRKEEKFHDHVAGNESKYYQRAELLEKPKKAGGGMGICGANACCAGEDHDHAAKIEHVKPPSRESSNWRVTH